MLRRIVPALLALSIALVGGIYSADWTTDNFNGFDALHLGAWTANPKSGSHDADPYSKARAARTGTLPLGTAEGLIFVAAKDSDGKPLDPSCDYVLSGRPANARLWTLRLADAELVDLRADDGSPLALHSRNIIRKSDGTMAINASRTIQPGNWLPIPQTDTIRFLLTLYDSAIASSVGIADQTMPLIKAENCNGR